MNTSWSSPKKNIIAGMLNLRAALASGYKAKLVREFNENCNYPIKKKKEDTDFKNYKFLYGRISTASEIKTQKNYSEFEKYLTLNYKNCFGTQEAIEKYYTTGEVSKDNFRGIGISHLVKVSDMVQFLEQEGDMDRAKMFKEQYITGEQAENKHVWDFYGYKHGSPYAVEKFKRKLWVVVLLDEKEKQPRIPLMVSVLNIIMYPLKYIPRKSVLRMPKYTNYTYRIGGIINGFSVVIQIPKKFSFKD